MLLKINKVVFKTFFFLFLSCSLFSQSTKDYKLIIALSASNCAGCNVSNYQLFSKIINSKLNRNGNCYIVLNGISNSQIKLLSKDLGIDIEKKFKILNKKNYYERIVSLYYKDSNYDDSVILIKENSKIYYIESLNNILKKQEVYEKFYKMFDELQKKM